VKEAGDRKLEVLNDHSYYLTLRCLLLVIPFQLLWVVWIIH